jgi:NitT/TauT family transport system substrate-binding protein
MVTNCNKFRENRVSPKPQPEAPEWPSLDGRVEARAAPWPSRLRAVSRPLAWLVAVCLSLSVNACTERFVEPLVFGMNAWVGHDPLALARDRGWIDAKQVKVVELSSVAETLRHFRNGLLSAAAISLDETLRLAEDGQDIRVIAVLDASAGADMVLARADLSSPEQLKGQSIAVENSAVGALMLQRLLQAGSLDRADVKVVPLKANLHLDALKSLQVAASISYEPLAHNIVEAGFDPIFDSRQMPGEIVNVLVVKGEALRERPDQIDALLAGWAEGLQAFKDDPQGVADLLAQGADLSPEHYLAILDRLEFYSPRQSLDLLAGHPPDLGQNSERLVRTLVQIGLLKDDPDWGRLIETGPAQRALQGEGAP